SANKEELLRKEQDKQQARLMALQYQVNPHFLFNALYWLQMKVEEEGLSSETSNAIASLGGVLHYNLSDTSHATLEQEAVHMRAYIQFMRIRHAQTIDLALEWPDILRPVEVLRFTFQPILENAIHHGLIPGKDLHIRVSIAPNPEDGMLRACVSNDGQPMNASQRRQLRERLDRAVRLGAVQDHGSIGLYNLAQRLRLYYGFRASLTLFADDRTTGFVIEMPYDPGLTLRESEDPIAFSEEGVSSDEFSHCG
nr:histidine kinase [Clostridia bacterium]